jgi:hypothetical protein
MAMSFYPTGAGSNSTWSTRAVEHTLRNLLLIFFPIPLSGPWLPAHRGGMEYPMITFNGGTYGRP